MTYSLAKVGIIFILFEDVFYQRFLLYIFFHLSAAVPPQQQLVLQFLAVHHD